MHPTPSAESVVGICMDVVRRGPFLFFSGCFMKSLLCAGVAGICLILPGISTASTVNFEVTGPGYTVLFDPQGSGACSLPPSYDYRSYDCRIGSKPTPVVVYTPPPKIETYPPVVNNPPAGPNLPVNQPIITEPVCPVPSAPLPASSVMGGAGLAMVAIFSWMRSRRPARA
jgi:hypothetical protein